MKYIVAVSMILALSTSGLAMAQSGADMQHMQMGKMQSDSSDKAAVHKATGVVTAIDTLKGAVTLKHGPVASLNWPAMTMSFQVKNKTFFEKLAVDKKVTIDFIKQDKGYVVTAVE